MRISDWSSDVCSSDLMAAYAIQFRDGGYGIPVLVGRNDVYDRLAALGIADPHSFEVHNSVNSPLVPKMVEFLYQRLQRRGYLRRDCERMVNRDRNIFGALLLQLNEAEAMITGLPRTYSQSIRERSAERRVGTECVRTCRTRWSPDH